MSLAALFQRPLRAINALCVYDHCRVPLPWFVWTNGTDAVSRLRRHILALDYGRPLQSVGPLRTALAAGLHLLRGTREIILVWRAQHAACRKGYGVPAGRQLAQLFVATFRHNFPPSLYYRARLFRLTRDRWPAVFSHGETTLMLVTFEQATQHLGLWTKSGWARFCATEGLATVPVAAVADRGQLSIRDASLLEPGRDLFLKPDRDYSGRGGIMLEWDASTHGWNALGATTGFIAADALADFLRTHSREASFVVQRRLRNAASLADLAPRALVNARIVTLRAADGTITVMMAALRLPPGDQPTSDVIGHTLAVPIDLETGELGQAECGQIALGSCDRHPFHGAPLNGRMLSEWPQMREHALAAHQRLPFMPAVGWDLVATEAGVFILEANAVWNGNLAQHWGRAPLGETAWPELMLSTLRAGAASTNKPVPTLVRKGETTSP